MDNAIRLEASDVYKHFVCELCAGLLIDATALSECSHSFCRSCIVKHCKRGLGGAGPVYCPAQYCNTEIHRTKPFSKLKNDATLQTLVYKLFPQVYKAEMQHRADFYKDKPNFRAFFTTERPPTNEDLGIAQNADWLPVDIPKHLAISLSYRSVLTERLELSPELKRKDAMAKDASSATLYVESKTTVEDLKVFVINKYSLRNKIAVELILTNVVLATELTLKDLVRLYPGKGKKDLHLDYIFVDSSCYTDDLSKEAALIRFLRPVTRPIVKPINKPAPSEEPTSPKQKRTVTMSVAAAANMLNRSLSKSPRGISFPSVDFDSTVEIIRAKSAEVKEQGPPKLSVTRIDGSVDLAVPQKTKAVSRKRLFDGRPPSMADVYSVFGQHQAATTTTVFGPPGWKAQYGLAGGAIPGNLVLQNVDVIESSGVAPGPAQAKQPTLIHLLEKTDVFQSRNQPVLCHPSPSVDPLKQRTSKRHRTSLPESPDSVQEGQIVRGVDEKVRNARRIVMVKGNWQSTNWYEKNGSDHTYAMDPDMEPVSVNSNVSTDDGVRSLMVGNVQRSGTVDVVTFTPPVSVSSDSVVPISLVVPGAGRTTLGSMSPPLSPRFRLIAPKPNIMNSFGVTGPHIVLANPPVVQKDFSVNV